MPKLLIFISLLILVTGCSNRLFTVYKLDVQQGNALTQEDAAKITAGMPQDQVLSLLGKPVLNPSFADDRWDYIFYQRPAHSDVEKRILSVYFENDRVSSVNFTASEE